MVWDGWGGPSKDPKYVGKSYGRSGTGRGTHPKIRDGSGDRKEGPGRVVGPSQRSGMGWGILPKVQDGLGDPSGGPGWVGGPSIRFGTGREDLQGVWDGSRDPQGDPRRVGGPSGRSGTGRGPSKMSGTRWEVLWKVRNGWGGHPEGPGQVGNSSRKSRMGREVLLEVRDWLEDPPKFRDGL